jgi:hypothetical protein
VDVIATKGRERRFKFDPANPDSTSTLGEEAEFEFECGGNGVLAAGDGYI